MIYPKAIFRTVIALSTVAAATQATVASPKTVAKRGKDGRYVDTVNVYEQTAATTLLNVGGSPSNYAGVSKAQNGASLRKVTSPQGSGGKFSAASPTNAAAPCPEGKGAAGKSGQTTYFGPTPSKNSGVSPVWSPRSLDGKHGKDDNNYGGKSKGGKDGNYGGKTVEVPVAGDKGGNYGGKGGKGGKAGDIPETGGKDGNYGGKKKGGNYGGDVPTSPARSPTNDKKNGSPVASPKGKGGKSVEVPVSPSSGGSKIGIPIAPSSGGVVTAPPAPISPSTGSKSGKGASTAGSQAYQPPVSPTKTGGSGSGKAYGKGGSTQPPSSPTKTNKSGNGSGGVPTAPLSPTGPNVATQPPTKTGGSGSGKKSGNGSQAGSNAGTPAYTPSSGKGGQGSKGGSTGGSKASTPAATTPVATTPAPVKGKTNQGKPTQNASAKQSDRR